MVRDDDAVGLDAVEVVFDDERVVSDAGVALVATLAGRLGVEAVVGRFVTLRRDRPGVANAGRKVMALIYAMLLGADSIDAGRAEGEPPPTRRRHLALTAWRGTLEPEICPRTRCTKACEDPGRDGSRLPGCAKTYLPPPAGQWGMVFQLRFDSDQRPFLACLAFGIRHPSRDWQPSVYQVADRRLHGHTAA